MNKSEVIYKSRFYTASAMSDGSLIVQTSWNKKGVRLVGPSASVWIENIREAVAAGDKDEANLLCRSVASEARYL